MEIFSWANVHHMMYNEIVVMQFYYYFKIASQLSAVPEGLVYVTSVVIVCIAAR